MALSAGLLLGAAMKPQLAVDDRPAGPQILAGWSGERSTGPFDDGGGVAFAGYSGEIPDYVLGTDWRKALTPVVMAPPDPELTEEKDDAPSAYADELPAPQAADLAGGPAFESGAVRLEAPATADDAAQDAAAHLEAAPSPIEAEAPPEATGDTRVVDDHFLAVR